MELPVLPPSTDFRFRTQRFTRWSDEDNQKVVNNAVYLTLLEEARYQYFSDLGLVRDNQFPFVLMQTNVRFLSPGRGGEGVEIELKTTGFSSSSISQVSRIRAIEGGRVLAEAQVLLVTWDPERRCKTTTEDSFRTAVEAFEAGPAADPATPS